MTSFFKRVKPDNPRKLKAKWKAGEELKYAFNWPSKEEHKEIRRKYKELRRREKSVLKDCGCVCYCPECNDILNDQAECRDNIEEQKVYYTCGCGAKSVWTFDAAPAPILLSKHDKVKK